MALATVEPLTPVQIPDPTTAVARPPDSPPPLTTLDRSTVVGQGASWLHTNLRNIIALVLTGLICYLAFKENQGAMAALTAAFSVLMGAIWGERAALKVPGKDA
jgi:hypothetical protein